MNNNIFLLGDSFWLQLHGTAMGTPAAPLYSSITYRLHKNTRIQTKCLQHLLYYRRFIGDIIGIWIKTPDDSWTQFKLEINQLLVIWNGIRPPFWTFKLKYKMEHYRLTHFKKQWTCIHTSLPSLHTPPVVSKD